MLSQIDHVEYYAYVKRLQRWEHVIINRAVSGRSTDPMFWPQYTCHRVQGGKAWEGTKSGRMEDTRVRFVPEG